MAEVRDNLTIQATRVIRPAPKRIDSYRIISPSESEMKVVVPLRLVYKKTLSDLFLYKSLSVLVPI